MGFFKGVGYYMVGNFVCLSVFDFLNIMVNNFMYDERGDCCNENGFSLFEEEDEGKKRDR